VNDISNYAAAIYGLGIVSYREGKVDDALAKLNQVIQLNPTQFPNAFLARGGIRAERRQYTEALADFNQAIEIYKQQVSRWRRRLSSTRKRPYQRAEGGRRRKALIEAALEKALESKKTVELLRGGGLAAISYKRYQSGTWP